MSVPWWRLAEQSQRIQCELAIIGGGITGVSALRAATELHQHARLFERHTLAAGASGRNAGYLMRGAADNYVRARQRSRHDHAEQLWRISEHSLQRLIRWGIDRTPSFRHTPSCLIATTDTEAAELELSIHHLRQDGFDAHPLNTTATSDAITQHLPPRTAALVNPHDAVCSPREVILHLAAGLEDRIHQHQEVFAIEPDGDRLTLRTPAFHITAHAALLCTNANAPALAPQHADTITPNRGQMLALDATRLPASELPLRHAYYLDRGCDYIRQANATTILVGGRRHKHAEHERTAEDATTPPVQHDLEHLAEQRLGRRLPVTHRWAGSMGFSSTGLPVVGPTASPQASREQLHERFWIAAGFTGHGMSLAPEIAARATAAIRDHDPDAIPQPLHPQPATASPR